MGCGFVGDGEARDRALAGRSHQLPVGLRRGDASTRCGRAFPRSGGSFRRDSGFLPQGGARRGAGAWRRGMKGIIETVPHQKQRYETVGDWQWDGDTLKISVSDLGNWKYEMAIAYHELREA